MVQPLWKTVWRFLKKLKRELPYDPAIALLGIYPRDTGVLFRRDTCTPMLIAALSTTAKVWKEPKCPSMDEWIKTMWFIYTMEYHSPIRKNEILPFATTWMELEGITLSEISQRKTDSICFHSHAALEKLNRRPWGRGRGRGKIVSNREGGRQTIRDCLFIFFNFF